MATISTVKIANMALGELGTRNTIESMTESSVEAKHANLWYDYSRLLVLEGYDWNFARKRVALALHSEDPPDGLWAYRYAYPSDCVFARVIVNGAGTTSDPVPFTVEMSADGQEKTILTNYEDAILLYTRDVTETPLFSSGFVELLATALAHRMCIALTGSKNLKDRLLNDYGQMMNMAAAYNANEQMSAAPRDADSIRGRN